MDIKSELVNVFRIMLDTKKFKEIMFCLDNVPILAVIFCKDKSKDKNVTLLVNNMKDLRKYDIEFIWNVDDFVSDIYNIMVYSGLNELIKKSKDPKISFRSDACLYGTVNKDSIIIEKDDMDFGDGREPKKVHRKYEIDDSFELSGLIISRIAGAFASLYFM